MEIYEVLIGNIPHQMQLDKETADRIGAKPIAVQEPVKVPNKARRGKVKASVSTSDTDD